MNLTNTRIRRVSGTFTLIVTAAFLTTLGAVDARAQLNPAADFNQMMKNRQELSRRSIEEIRRRRFEEGKSDSTFPSDMANAKNAGVLRALTPEEQKALKHNDRGLQLFAKGKHDDAIKEYQQAIRSDPKLAAAHNNLGTSYFTLGRLEEAAAAFKQACELDNNYGQAFFNLGLTQIKLGNQQEANVTLDAALLAYVNSGEAHFKAGRFKEAEEAFRGMLQIDPEYAPALIRLGLVYNATRRYEEAAQVTSRVVSQQRSNAAAHEILAEALYGTQKYEDAAVSAERAIKLTPDSTEGYYFAGLARASLGQRDPALAHLNSLRQLKANDLAEKLSDAINKKAPAKSNDDDE